MISFFKENVRFDFNGKSILKKWIKAVTEQYGKQVGELNYIFCSDEYLLDINNEYLQHNYYTDIITFDQAEDEDKIEGEIYISIDRIKDNCKTNAVTFENELLRVMIHGVLHLIGFNDKTDAESKKMRTLESEAITKLTVPRGAISKTK